MMNKQSLLFFYFIHSIFGLEKFLQFIPHIDVTIRKSVYELDEEAISVDAFQNSQILIKYIQSIRDFNFPELKFYCHIKTLETKYQISNAYLCKKESINAHEDCHTISKDTRKIKFQEHMEFETKFDPATGIVANLNMDINIVKSRQKPFDGYYYCKLDNILGSISSNYIEIQDFEFYKKKLSNMIDPITRKYEPSPISNFTSDSFPLYLDCGKSVGNYEGNIPTWADKNLLSSFAWQICPDVTNGIQCFLSAADTQKKSSRPLDEFMNYYQYPNGTIILLGIKGNDYVKSGLFCGIKAISPKLYSVYLVKSKTHWEPISYSILGKYNKRIMKISPEINNVFIREGNYRSSRFKLYASYVGNQDHTKITTEWKKDTYSLPSTFTQGPYQLVFPIEINESHSGKYDLKITQSEPYDTATFSYVVSIVSSPKLQENIKHPSIFYLTVDQPALISVSFERDITKLSVEVNNMPINLMSAKTKEKSINDLCHKFPFLTGILLSANISLNEGLISYEAKNLVKRSNSPQAKTHTVTFIAENAIGVSKVSYLIRVFENPTFINYLNDFNCTNNCMDDQEHVFKCSINDTEYKNEGFTVKYFWTINGLNVNNMKEEYEVKAYLEMNNDKITLKPIRSANSGRDKQTLQHFAKSNLSCRIDIYNPINPSAILYSTDQYPNLRPMLEAKINLQTNSVETASTSRYLPIVISLIVTAIIVVLVLYFCLRGTGETYNVDQKERAHGHDPEKEIRDNEIFQPYERDHETNVVQPSHLSFNDDDSVGVGSDDGELDVYDIDPGKFNEEGSFIGQYASDPRKNKIINS